MQTATYNIPAEQEILASIILNNDSILDVIDKLTPNDFFMDKHRMLYEVMIELYGKERPIDEITITDQIKEIDKIGGYGYLADLMASGLSKVKQEDINIVKEKSNLRKILKFFQQAAFDINENKKSFKDVFDQIQNVILDFECTDKKNLASDAMMIKETLNLVDKNTKNGGGILGVKTGIDSLDKVINGLQKGRLYVLAGRPGMGKSALVLNICQNLSENYKILNFSMEMGLEEIGVRRLAMKSLLDSTNIERGRLSDRDLQRLIKTSAFISKGGCVTNCKPNIHVNEIFAQAKKMKMQQGLDVLIIDHLGLLNMKGIGETLREQTTNICIRLKNMSKELEIPIILLSQLSRECEKRWNKSPMLSDLKESGGIEENADVVMLLYRDEYYNPETKTPNVIECDIAKQRNGRTGVIKLAWQPQYQLITDLANKNLGGV